MPSLYNKSVGDSLIEFFGPVQNRNAFHTTTPSVTVQVFGPGAVRVQYNTEFIIAGNSGLNFHSSQRIPDPEEWTDAGSMNISMSDGATNVDLVSGTVYNVVRVLLVTEGTGHFVIKSNWM